MLDSQVASCAPPPCYLHVGSQRVSERDDTQCVRGKPEQCPVALRHAVRHHGHPRAALYSAESDLQWHENGHNTEVVSITHEDPSGGESLRFGGLSSSRSLLGRLVLNFAPFVTIFPTCTCSLATNTRTQGMVWHPLRAGVSSRVQTLLHVEWNSQTRGHDPLHARTSDDRRGACKNFSEDSSRGYREQQ